MFLERGCIVVDWAKPNEDLFSHDSIVTRFRRLAFAADGEDTTTKAIRDIAELTGKLLQSHSVIV